MVDFTIVTQPEATSVPAGSPLSAYTGFSAYVAVQWLKGGNPVAGQTAQPLYIASAQESDSGLYSCMGTDLSGSVESSAVWLLVEPAQPAAKKWRDPNDGRFELEKEGVECLPTHNDGQA
jgi:hypothetical protein